MAIPTKQALLQALSGAEGRYISGEQLAQTLGVSRAAIHKAAAALTTQGYTLEAAPRRGYRLLGGDPFCADAVGEYPAPVYVHERLDSSNQTAKRLALAGAPHGTLVLAGQQSAGRGRMGRRFESPAGKGIYLSLVLRVPVPASVRLWKDHPPAGHCRIGTSPKRTGGGNHPRRDRLSLSGGPAFPLAHGGAAPHRHTAPQPLG